MNRLITIKKIKDIPSEYRDTPIEHLLEYQNLGRRFRKYTKAALLIGMCMDNRKRLYIPDNFAFVLRTGGANLHHNGFKVSYAIAVGGVRHIALIGHNHCGMSGLRSRRHLFIKGMVKNAGWKKTEAEKYFKKQAALFEIGNEADFITGEAKRIRRRYPKIMVAPMIYKIEDGRLYLLNEKS